MSANLTSEMGSIDRIVVLINECKKMGIEVRPPDINVSFEDFRPIDNKTISYGLNAIKNVGTKALATIIKERISSGPYKNIFDICSRVEQQKVNKRVLESLVYSGSMDSLEGSRAQNFDAVDIAIKYGQKIQQVVDKNQVDLFGTGESQNELIKTPTLGDSEEWSEKDALSKEMEVLGLYVSGHPLLEHADDLEEFTTVSFEKGQEISKKDTVLVGGMITKIVRRYDKRNREMAFFDLDCLGGHAEIVVFSDCYKSYGNLIDDGKVVFIRGKPSETSDFSDLKILSDEIISVENVRDRLSQRLNIKFAIGKVETSDIDDLMAISKSNPGGCKLLFHLPNPDSPKPLKVLAHNVSVSTNITFIKQLRDKYGKDNVWID